LQERPEKKQLPSPEIRLGTRSGDSEQGYKPSAPGTTRGNHGDPGNFPQRN
jgi:hypothetical protein